VILRFFTERRSFKLAFAERGRADQKVPRIIEFVGIPGAGKSTIAARLEERLRDSVGVAPDPTVPSAAIGWISHRLRNRIWLVGTAFRNPRLLIRAGQLAATTRPVTKGRIKTCVRLLRFDRDPSPGSGRFVIRDQGKIQRTWSALMFADVEADEKHLAALWGSYSRGRIDTVVYVHCAVDTALNRLHHRLGNASRVERLESAEARPILMKGGVRLRRLAEQCAEVDGARVILVDGENPLEVNVAMVLNLLSADEERNQPGG
jgi:thymidylate kinase